MLAEIVKLFLDDRGKKNTFDLALGMKLFRVLFITLTYAFIISENASP